MSGINFKKEVKGDVEAVVASITEQLKTEGFGILTRIDFHSKMKEKLGKDVPATVILGACSPQMAYQAYTMNTDVTSLMPCNVVVRDLGAGTVSVEVAKPSALLAPLGDKALDALTGMADDQLKSALSRL